MIDIGALPTVEAPPIQMRQLFQHLLGNASKYRKQDTSPIVKIMGNSIKNGQVPEGGKTTREQQDYWEIVVEDNGIGFDPQYADRIFGMFPRLHGRSEYEGTGVGLAICKKIVESHHGTIVASGMKDQGEKYILHLPVKQHILCKKHFIKPADHLRVVYQ